MKRLILVALLGLIILISRCSYPQRINELEKKLITVNLRTEILETEKVAEKLLKECQQQTANQKRIANNLAVSLSQLNALIDNQNLMRRINEVLVNNGYPGLVKQEGAVPDSLRK